MPPSHSRAMARAHDVDQPDAAPALAADLLHGEQGVDGLAGLAHRDIEGVGLDDRVAVAELAGRLGVGGDPGELLDQRGTHLADVVGRAAAEDLHPPHGAQVAGVHVEAAEVRGAEALVEPAAQHRLRGGRAARGSPCACRTRGRRRRTPRRRCRPRVAVLPVEARSWCRIVLKPAAVTVAISPSSSIATVVVWRTIAARSEATYISLSPTPTTSGLPLRAATMRSGKSACRTARP